MGLGGAVDSLSRPFEAIDVAASQLKGLFDPFTGQPLAVRVPDGYQTSPLYFVQWLDDDRFTLISGGGPPGDWPTGDLLVCRIAAERCSVAIEASTWNRRPLYPLIPGGGGVGGELALQQAMRDASD